MSKLGLLPISSSPIREKNKNRWYLLKYPICHVKIVSEHTLRYTKSCVWISVKINMYSWDYISKNRFRVSKFPARPLFYHFTNTHFPSKNKSWIEETNFRFFFIWNIITPKMLCVLSIIITNRYLTLHRTIHY